MSKKHVEKSTQNRVVPGDKIAVIEEFLPDETCFEQDGSILSMTTGEVIPDQKKHKITVKPLKQSFQLERGDTGVGRVVYVKKQIASVDIHRINSNPVPIPINSILHVSEASRRFVRNMYEVTRPGDWLKFRIVRTMKPVYISLIGEELGVVIAQCNHCGHDLEFYRRNTLKCPNCSLIQNRVTSDSFGKLVTSFSRPPENETR
ncbi:MAG: exosome complex RNA-binding protein Csl4 [Candidatus Hodarchaeales archaeon]|jgi:exosome complex RNA-binding protein Csl4